VTIRGTTTETRNMSDGPQLFLSPAHADWNLPGVLRSIRMSIQLSEQFVSRLLERRGTCLEDSVLDQLEGLDCRAFLVDEL
jgi:hypothetical protein